VYGDTCPGHGSNVAGLQSQCQDTGIRQMEYREYCESVSASGKDTGANIPVPCESVSGSGKDRGRKEVIFP